jgi:catechol 2,3-dioxygenase-like lactoylglutathione lyase family enzyme
MIRHLIGGLDHVQIEAPPGHEAQARAFYGGFLGLSELQKPEGTQLHTGVVGDFEPRKKGHLCLRCTDLNAVLERAQAFGIDATEDIQLAPLRRAFLHDPFGNRLEVVEGGHEHLPLG